mgnify:CR=1 FL=1
MIVAQGIILKNGKVLIGLRNSPDDPDAHGLWQCPAGLVEFAEDPLKAAVREVKEETGFKVKIVSELPHVANVLWKHDHYQAQVVLLSFVCKIISGRLLYGQRENSGWNWITQKDFNKFKFTPGTKQALKWFFGKKS